MTVPFIAGHTLPMNDFYDTRVRTTDVATTEAWLRAQYGRVDLRADEAAYAEHLVGDAAFSLRHLEWSARVDLSYESDRFLVVSSTPGCAWSVGQAEGEFSVSPGMLQPGDRLVARVDHPELEVVTFDPERLAATARTLYGDDDLDVRFRGVDPVSPPLRAYWESTLRWARTQVPIMAEPLVRAHVHRTLAVAALEVFPLVADARERRASALEQAAVYRSATAWLDDHASLPVTIEDAARAAGSSTDGLRRAFAANGCVASTPEEYLELARLSAAHVDLVAADAACTTLALVARRWGFTNVESFAVAYRAAYRREPQATLDR
ncbi:helix-turn-helix domain-containing protein [Microbacterium sp.]|uniref:helix-turn-helix transcriptional regulator n=1 Tax=Microbacterium sp. TaxID=51671 RepID=UPI0025D66494|nr:helix-turn-helix domain-containing protein [Microbacterium sp.]MBT9607308.1 helix-turn-helix domain-containing protein [Microbacterium sp.]